MQLNNNFDPFAPIVDATELSAAYQRIDELTEVLRLAGAHIERGDYFDHEHNQAMRDVIAETVADSIIA